MCCYDVYARVVTSHWGSVRRDLNATLAVIPAHLMQLIRSAIHLLIHFDHSELARARVHLIPVPAIRKLSIALHWCWWLYLK